MHILKHLGGEPEDEKEPEDERRMNITARQFSKTDQIQLHPQTTSKTSSEMAFTEPKLEFHLKSDLHHAKL